MSGGKLGRRAAIGASLLAVSGCSFLEDLFTDDKPRLPGKREPVLTARRTLETTGDIVGKGAVTLPPAIRNAAWPQAGGNPAHLMGHLAAAPRLAEAWRTGIGEGGGYRQKILAQPVIGDGVVYAMDSAGVVSALETAGGRRKWRFNTVPDEDDSTNVGGGLAYDEGTLYAVNGLGDVNALVAATGKVRFHRRLDVPTRSAPTVAEGRLFVATIDDRLFALATDDGRQLWSHQGISAVAGMLGEPAATYSDGLVIAAFSSGELACLRAATGSVVWTDSLAATRGRTSLADLSSIRGLPVIDDGRVHAIGLGNLLVTIDLRSGRRLWERDIAGQDNLWAAGDWLFLVSAEQQVAAINRLDGRVAWVTDLPHYDDPEKKRDQIFWFGPVLAGDRLIVAGTNEQALAISPYTGEVLGRQPLSGAASLAPVVADGTVYVVTDDGSLLALR